MNCSRDDLLNRFLTPKMEEENIALPIQSQNHKINQRQIIFDEFY